MIAKASLTASAQCDARALKRRFATATAQPLAAAVVRRWPSGVLACVVVAAAHGALGWVEYDGVRAAREGSRGRAVTYTHVYAHAMAYVPACVTMVVLSLVHAPHGSPAVLLQGGGFRGSRLG